MSNKMITSVRFNSTHLAQTMDNSLKASSVLWDPIETSLVNSTARLESDALVNTINSVSLTTQHTLNSLDDGSVQTSGSFTTPTLLPSTPRGSRIKIVTWSLRETIQTKNILHSIRLYTDTVSKVPRPVNTTREQTPFTINPVHSSTKIRLLVIVNTDSEYLRSSSLSIFGPVRSLSSEKNQYILDAKKIYSSTTQIISGTEHVRHKYVPKTSPPVFQSYLSNNETVRERESKPITTTARNRSIDEVTNDVTWEPTASYKGTTENRGSITTPNVTPDHTLAIVTGVVGGLIFLALLAILVVLICRRKQRSHVKQGIYVYGAHDRLKKTPISKRPRSIDNPEYTVRPSIFGRERNEEMASRLNSNPPRRSEKFVSKLNSQEIESPAHQTTGIVTGTSKDICKGLFVKVMCDPPIPMKKLVKSESLTSSTTDPSTDQTKAIDRSVSRPYHWQIEANVYEELSPTSDYPDVIQPAGPNPLDIRSRTVQHVKRFVNLHPPKYRTTQLV